MKLSDKFFKQIKTIKLKLFVTATESNQQLAIEIADINILMESIKINMNQLICCMKKS